MSENGARENACSRCGARAVIRDDRGEIGLPAGVSLRMCAACGDYLLVGYRAPALVRGGVTSGAGAGARMDRERGCPRCGVAPGRACRTPGGYTLPNESHAERR